MPETTRELKAGDIMTSPPRTIHANATLADAARLMLDHRIGCLPVVDEDGAYMGIVTDDSFFPRHKQIPFGTERLAWVLGAWLGNMDEIEETLGRLGESRVGDAMIQRSPVKEDDSLPEVARRLLDEGTHHVVVLRDGQIVGVVSRHDMAKLVIGPRS